MAGQRVNTLLVELFPLEIVLREIAAVLNVVHLRDADIVRSLAACDLETGVPLRIRRRAQKVRIESHARADTARSRDARRRDTQSRSRSGDLEPSAPER